MEALDYVTITSPTDVISGVYALFQAEIAQQAVAGGRTPTKVTFYIYASKAGASKTWHEIDSLTARADGDPFTADDRTFASTRLVPNDYADGIGQLKVVVEFSDGAKYDQQMVVEITTGVAMCWDLNLDGTGESWATIEPTLPKQLVKGQTNGINIVACNPSEDSTISSVSFFMVTKSEYSGETTEELKTTQYSSPYSINPLIVDSYQFDMDVIISAKVTQNDGKIVGYALPAFVYEPNQRPTDLGFVQTQTIYENTDTSATGDSWIAFGTVDARDGNQVSMGEIVNRRRKNVTDNVGSVKRFHTR